MNMTDEILNSWTDADECLADKIERIDEKVSTLNTDSKFTVADIIFTKYGQVCNFYKNMTTESAAIATSIGEDARVATELLQVCFPIFAGSGGSYAPIANGAVWITSAGKIYLYKPAGVTSFYVSGTYISKNIDK